MKFYSSTLSLAFIMIVAFPDINLYGQDNNVETQFCLSNPVPSPPGSASFENYTNMPVDLYAGKPSIEIPIWDVRSRSISVPLQLSYNSSGIRVQDVSDWVGMGWTLIGPGVITRTVRGLPDDNPTNGYFLVGSQIPTDLSQMYYIGNYTLDQCQALANGSYDFEPDIFSFNFSGHFGQIIFGFDSLHNLNYYINPYQDLKVSFTWGGTNGTGIHTWTIIDESGTTYIFGQGLIDNSDNESSIFDQGDCGSIFQTPYYSSWVLMKIISPSKGDTISFSYRDLTETLDFVGISEYENIRTNNLCTCPGIDPSQIFPPLEYNECSNQLTLSNVKKLTSINTASTTVEFISDTTAAITDGVKLDSILIEDRATDSIIRTFLFYYLYTKGSNPDLSYRLWLDSISEVSSGLRKTYKITYNHPDSLPPRDSRCIDHWGYFNNNHGVCDVNGSHPTLLPLTNIGGINYGGADRSCDTARVNYGMIDSIIYPTGGYTKFTYESNDFSRTQHNDSVITIHYIDMYADAVHQCYEGADSMTLTDFYVDHGQQVNLAMDSHKCGNPQDGLQAFVGVQGVDNNYYREWGGSSMPSSTRNIFLNAGHYQLFAYADNLDNYSHISATWENCDTTINNNDTVYYQYGGGVRIKRIVDFDGRQSSVRHFVYRLFDNNLLSSGTLMSALPGYTFPSIRNYGYSPDGSAVLVCSCPYLTITANSTRQQETTHGNHVGYSEVQELIGENGENGKILHSYRLLKDIGGDYMPFPPKTNLEWERGMETESQTIDKNGHKRQDIINYYNSTNKNSAYNFHSIGAVKVGWYSKW